MVINKGPDDPQRKRAFKEVDAYFRPIYYFSIAFKNALTFIL
jgi:hypothetical protein